MAVGRSDVAFLPRLDQLEPHREQPLLRRDAHRRRLLVVGEPDLELALPELLALDLAPHDVVAPRRPRSAGAVDQLVVARRDGERVLAAVRPQTQISLA